MLGVFTLLATALQAVEQVFSNIWFAIATVWHFFELYGWRVTIGAVSTWCFIQRIWKEHERRSRLVSARQAADPSRVRALSDRRDDVVRTMEVRHTTTIDDKRRKDNERRLRQLEELEKKIVGNGVRLGRN